MISYKENYDNQLKYLGKILPEALDFLNSEYNLIGKEQALLFDRFISISLLIDEYINRSEWEHFDLDMEKIEWRLLNSSYVWLSRPALYQIEVMMQDHQDKLYTVKKMFITLCLFGLWEYTDIPPTWNILDDCFQWVYEIYGVEFLRLSKFSGFNKYFNGLNGFYRNSSPWGNHRSIGMLLYNQFASKKGLTKNKMIHAQNVELSDSVAQWNQIDKLFDENLIVRKNQDDDPFWHWKDWKVIFNEDRIDTPNLSRYFWLDIQKSRQVSGFLLIPKDWIKWLQISKTEKISAIFGNTKANRRMKILKSLQDSLERYEQSLKEIL